MKQFVLPLLLLFASFTVDSLASDKVIYNFTDRVSYCGDGQEIVIKARGQMIWDPATNLCATVAAVNYLGYKAVFMDPVKTQQVFIFKGAKGKEYTGIAVAQFPDKDVPNNLFETGLIKGRRYSILIGNTTFVVPKHMTETAKSADQSTGGEPVLAEASGTYVLDVNASAASNSRGETVEQAATAFKQGYLALGYQDGNQ